MPVLQLPPPASHSAAAAAAAASTSAPGPNPETVHGASAAPEAEQELWEMESRARACGKWSSSECAGHLWNLQGPPSLLHFSGTAVARGGDTRYPDVKGAEQSWPCSTTGAAYSWPASGCLHFLRPYCVLASPSAGDPHPWECHTKLPAI